jgi:hypothetical protein
MLTGAEISLPILGRNQEDICRSRSTLLPLTIKTEPHDYLSAKHKDDVEEHDLLDSSLNAMDWLPRLNSASKKASILFMTQLPAQKTTSAPY